MNAQNEGKHETKLTPSCQSEQQIPQRPAAQWCSLVGERKWAVLVRAEQNCALGGRAAKERVGGAPRYSSLAKLVSGWLCWVSLDEGKFIIINYSSPGSLLCVQGDRCATSS